MARKCVAMPNIDCRHCATHCKPEQGRNDGGQKGHNSPGAGSLWGRRMGSQMSAGEAENPNNFTSSLLSSRQ